MYDSLCGNSNAYSYAWTNGDVLSYTNWGYNEPSQNGCCVLIDTNDGLWNDVQCNRLRYALCGICNTRGIKKLTQNKFGCFESHTAHKIVCAFFFIIFCVFFLFFFCV